MAILCKYTYDPLDRVSTVTPSAQAVANRFYNGEQLMTELHGDRQRTCIRAGGQLLAQQSREGDEVVTTMIAGDRSNSVLHASEDGHQADIAYSPYGHHDTAQALDGMPGFNGEQSDPLTGYYLLGNGYRAYNPVLMRFNSPDSLSPFGKGGVNAYAYCAGDPVNRVDPTGHESAWFWVSLGLSVLGALGGVRGIVASKGAKTMAVSAAGLLTGVAGVIPTIGSMLTKDAHPETSSILNYVGFGLGVASTVLWRGSLAARRMRQRRSDVQAGANRLAGLITAPHSTRQPPPYSLRPPDAPPEYSRRDPYPFPQHIAAREALGASTASSINSPGGFGLPLQSRGSNAGAAGRRIRYSI
ncbi:RHS repeat-associated core domain-containing protein [Pseudomonas syringae pv. pisi str. PP1]|uniref:RHS repeat-associated core domain-containing protein n=1 Tax=Pseudomonas syringae TaxID=317 RepID=UPI0009AF6817|nr:RHS repeat-associated core domain-containing protein [Pseudomonas syringae]AZG84526.1 RHS repeat-associated core domain-containing protein [Pseudomonas syringae pv. pisi str. PP1]RMM27704.1 YD repeat-containing protein-containing protein-containing protein [Pseudomonas syringae pv. pisi]UZS62953.1 RHS repeat-associated core domain-containing protein [Pseudomonas syringae]